MKTRKLIKIMFMCCALSLVMGVFASAVNYNVYRNYGYLEYTSDSNYFKSIINEPLKFDAGLDYSLKFNFNIITDSFKEIRIAVNPSGLFQYLMIYSDLSIDSSVNGWTYNINNISFEDNVLSFILNFKFNNNINNGFSGVYIYLKDGVSPPDDYSNFTGGYIEIETSPTENLMSGINSVSSSILESTGSIFSFITSSNVLPYVLIGVSVSLVSVIIYFGKRYIF